jgi:Circadian oscillating protein COP23
MAFKLLSLTLTNVAICGLAMLVTTTIAPQLSYAGNRKFSCAQSGGVPATFASREDGRTVPIIRWAYSFSSLTPLQRCQQVSDRFQRSYDNGTLKTIITGTLNKQPVVCAVVSTNDACSSSNVLFTLKPGSNPRDVIKRLFDRRALASGEIQNQSRDDTQIYIDFDTYLNSLQPEG